MNFSGLFVGFISQKM